MNHTLIKCVVVLIVCKIFGSRLNDISYSIKKNGIMVSIDYTKPINNEDIIGWKSDRGWVYLTLLGVSSPKDRIPKNFFDDNIKKIVIDDFNESTQIAILVKKPILGYDIINSKNTSSTILFIHTELNNSEISSIKNHIKNNGNSVFNLSENSSFPKYNTNFKNAFNKARQELGSNAIFKFHGKLYTTNHPGENKDSYSVLINKEMDFDKDKNILSEAYINKETGEEIVEDLSSNQIYSFFKDKFIEKEKEFKIPKKTKNQLNKSNDKQSDLISENQLLNKNIKNSLKSKVNDNSDEDVKKFYDSDSDFDSIDNENDWLNDRFPEKNKTYSGYHPNWSFPDDRQSLDYLPKNDKKYKVPESFPKRITEPGFSYFYYGGIRVSANMNGVPIYIDGKYVGETPLNIPIQVEPGWHQVSGFSSVYNHLSSKNSLQFISADPIINNNELYGSETTYIESGKVETVYLKFNHMGDTPKKWNEINGGMLIGVPVISLIFSLIIWGIG